MDNRDLSPANGVQGSSSIYDFGTTPNTRVAVSQKVRLLAPAYGSGTKALYQMGVVSSFSPSMNKNVDQVRGIGFGDMIAELVPSVTEATTGSIERALLYLANLWQATGYASGVDGPVRSLAHHRWPFDIEMQLVFSSLADQDLGRANVGAGGAARGFGQGVQPVRYPSVPGGVTGPTRNPYTVRPQGHTAIITMYEACWFTSYQTTISQDQGQIVESGEVIVSDVHDFSSTYGEFLPSGNDPTVNELGSIRFGGGSDGVGGTTRIGAP
jgi:hypothetical protein